MSKWKQINFWLKQHYLCVIVWFVVVLIALIVVMAGNDKELVGYFSFACSLSGILLALVVIIHTWIDSADTRTVLTEVKSHLTDIHGAVGEVDKKTGGLEQLLKNKALLEQPKKDVVLTDAEQTKQPPLSVGVETPFKLSEIRIFPLLCIYCAVKSFQNNKKLDIPDVIFKMDPKEKKSHVADGLAGVVLGVFMMFEGLIGLHGIGETLETPMEITKCDSHIQESVVKELDKRIADPTNPPYSEQVKRWKEDIDDYCTS